MKDQGGPRLNPEQSALFAELYEDFVPKPSLRQRVLKRLKPKPRTHPCSWPPFDDADESTCLRDETPNT